MRLQRLEDIQFGGHEKVFKESSLRALLIAAFLTGLPAGIFYLHRSSGLPVIFVYSSGIIAAWALFEFYVFIRTFSPENWLLRLDHEKVVIKFRSFLNRHLPAADQQVVVIPLDEIKEVRAIRETVETSAKYGYSSKTKYAFFTELEIALNSVDTKELNERLKYEISVKAKTKHHHYPVSMAAGDKIRIEWKSSKTGVAPHIGRALELFAKYGVRVAPEIRETKDYRETSSVDKAEIETRILDLIQKGDVMKAKELAKHAYNMSLAEADTFVNELMGK